MLEQHRELCVNSNVFDFTALEEHFLNQVRSGSLDEWTEAIEAVLVDEYQDTNPLQEEIYFALISLGGAELSVTIVGDDDQAMYRFRGGSVELFADFAERCKQVTDRRSCRVDMVRNFRSQPEIVEFFNRHIAGDPAFQTARINPPKPEVVSVNSSSGIPVLGMFRPDEEALATDLACFLHRLADGEQIYAGTGGQAFHLSQDGAIGDVVFLSHSVEEASYNRFNRREDWRFPGRFRQAIENRGLQVFNPRGHSLRSIPDVQKLLGLILLSLDPHSTIIGDIRTTAEAQHFLRQWRDCAEAFMESNPAPNDGRGLSGFIQDWQNVASGANASSIPSEWPVLEIVFKLITWIPTFQRQPEHQVWLEALTRIIASATMASPYGMQLLQNVSGKSQGVHVERSRQSLVRDAFIPVAANEVQVDEDIMPSVPRDRLQFMTIHQSKGLEFPLVIVDVGSRFRIDHPKQRFLRFPGAISNVVQAEEDMEPYLASPIRGYRQGIDRTFDDLVRLYYVAYSRPQSVLMLVGNEAGLRYGPQRTIKNIALGWQRNETWPWRQDYWTRKPPVKVEPPFWEI